MIRGFFAPALVLVSMLVGGIVYPDFFNLPSLVITVGGSLIVTLFSYSRSQLRGLVEAVHALYAEKRHSPQDHVDELARLTRLYRLEGLKGLENQERHLSDDFLRQGVNMLVDLYREDTIHAKLERGLAGFLSQYEVSRQILKTLGKLLPAFGLIGTLIGMVLLLRNVSSQDPQALTTAMSIAVLTTLYGAVSANVIVAPILARLQSAAVERETTMRLTREWVMMIVHGNAAALADTLNSAQPIGVNEHPHMPRWTPFGLPVQR